MSGSELTNVETNLSGTMRNVETNLSGTVKNVENNLSNLMLNAETNLVNKLNNIMENRQFLQDWLNPNYFQTVVPFNFENVQDYDNLVNFFENDNIYGLNATNVSKGNLFMLGIGDKDSLAYYIIEIWESKEYWLKYVTWRTTGDPTLAFPQIINSPNFPDVSTAPGGIWQPGYYDKDLKQNLISNQVAAGIRIDVDMSNYSFNLLRNTVDFISRVFSGLLNDTNRETTSQFNPNNSITESIRAMFIQTGGAV